MDILKPNQELDQVRAGHVRSNEVKSWRNTETFQNIYSPYLEKVFLLLTPVVKAFSKYESSKKQIFYAVSVDLNKKKLTECKGVLYHYIFSTFHNP